MPRNISFNLTKEQFIAQQKTETRRVGWLSLKPGDILNGCEKCQGLKKGEKINVLGQIRVVSVRCEELGKITLSGVKAEGFPYLTPDQFVDFFCQTQRVDRDTEITLIEFEYLEPL